MFTYQTVMVIITIVSLLMGITGKFFWDKMTRYDKDHTKVNGRIDELDTRLTSRINLIENRATAIESTTVTKDDLYQMANVLREDNIKRDEKIYEKLEVLSSKIEDLRYEQSRKG